MRAGGPRPACCIVPSMSRWHLACDCCDAAAWIGPTAGGYDAWCESCQSGRELPPGTGPDASCPDCGLRLSTGGLRFEEFFGELQNVAAVLSAWDGDRRPLEEILPERPRFLSDLAPPDTRADDGPEVRAALAALRAGCFLEAGWLLRPLLSAPAGETGSDRLWRALGIASERAGDAAEAEACFTRALATGPTGEEERRLRLARGCLAARRGDFAAAAQDFAASGDGREARWNRAALRVIEAVALARGCPSDEVIAEARAEAGEPSSHWSAFTVGRLLWTVLVERARREGGQAEAPGPPAPDVGEALRAAERLFEFETFWDRALVVSGYAALGMRAEAADAAGRLCETLLGSLTREPFLRSPPAAPLAAAVLRAAQGAAAGQPGVAVREVRALMERGDVSRYRVPCGRCGRGSIGVDGVEEDESPD